MNLIKSNIDRLKALEGAMKQFDQVEVGVIHHFAPGVYAREMHVRAGTMLTGKIHKHAHLNVMSKGKAILVNEDGRQIVEAPFSFVSRPGTKRAFYAYSDVVWTTIHPTDLTDLDEIERELIAEDYLSLESEHELDSDGDRR